MPARNPAIALRAGSRLLLPLLLASACTEGLPSEPLPAAVALEVKPVETQLPDGQSMQYRPVLLDQSGKPLSRLPTGTHLQWTVSDPTIASIDGNGAVRALRPGTVSVSASLVANASGSVVPSPPTSRWPATARATRTATAAAGA